MESCAVVRSNSNVRESPSLTSRPPSKSFKGSYVSKMENGNELLESFSGRLNELKYSTFTDWIGLVNDFLILVCTFKNKFASALEKECEMFSGVWLECAGNIETNLLKRLNHFDEESLSRRKELRRKLKTIYGHPKHRRILDEMTKSATAFCEDHIEDLKRIVAEYRDKAKKLLELFKEEETSFGDRIETQLNKLYSNEEVDKMLADLASYLFGTQVSNTVMKYLSRGQNQLQCEVGHSQRPERADSIGDGSCCEPGAARMRRAELLICELTGSNQLPPGGPNEPQRIVELKAVADYKNVIKNLKSDLVNSAKKLGKLCRIALLTYIRELQEWHYLWKVDCSRLTNLYDYS